MAWIFRKNSAFEFFWKKAFVLSSGLLRWLIIDFTEADNQLHMVQISSAKCNVEKLCYKATFGGIEIFSNVGIISHSSLQSVLFWNLSRQDWLNTHFCQRCPASHTVAHITGSCQQPQQGALQPQFPAVSLLSCCSGATGHLDSRWWVFSIQLPPPYFLRQPVIHPSGFPVRGRLSQPVTALNPSYQAARCIQYQSSVLMQRLVCKILCIYNSFFFFFLKLLKSIVLY